MENKTIDNETSINDSSYGEYKINIEHPECNRTVVEGKVLRSKKTYKVTITYVQVTEDEAKIKRAIIESIIRKGYFNKS